MTIETQQQGNTDQYAFATPAGGVKLPGTRRKFRNHFHILAIVGAFILNLFALVKFGSLWPLLWLLPVDIFTGCLVIKVGHQTIMDRFKDRLQFRSGVKSGDFNYDPNTAEAGFYYDGESDETTTPEPVPVEPPVWVPTFRLHNTFTPYGTQCVLIDTQNSILSATIEIEGPGDQLSEPDIKNENDQRVQRLLERIYRSTKVRHIKITAKTLPNTLEDHRQWVDDRRAGFTDLPDLPVRQYDELLSALDGNVPATRYYFTAAIPITTQLTNRIEHAASDHDDMDTHYAKYMAGQMVQIVSLLSGARHRLRRMLDKDALCALIRSTIDPVHWSDQQTASATLSNCWSAWDADNTNHTLIRGTWGQTLQRAYHVAKFNEARVPRGTFTELLELLGADASTWRTDTLIIRLVPKAKARAAAVAETTSQAALVLGQKEKGRIYVDQTAAENAAQITEDLGQDTPHHGAQFTWYKTLAVEYTGEGEDKTGNAITIAEDHLNELATSANVIFLPMTYKHHLGLSYQLPMWGGLDG